MSNELKQAQPQSPPPPLGSTSPSTPAPASAPTNPTGVPAYKTISNQTCEKLRELKQQSQTFQNVQPETNEEKTNQQDENIPLDSATIDTIELSTHQAPESLYPHQHQILSYPHQHEHEQKHTQFVYSRVPLPNLPATSMIASINEIAEIKSDTMDISSTPELKGVVHDHLNTAITNPLDVDSYTADPTAIPADDETIGGLIGTAELEIAKERYEEQIIREDDDEVEDKSLEIDYGEVPDRDADVKAEEEIMQAEEVDELVLKTGQAEEEQTDITELDLDRHNEHREQVVQQKIEKQKAKHMSTFHGQPTENEKVVVEYKEIPFNTTKRVHAEASIDTEAIKRRKPSTEDIEQFRNNCRMEFANSFDAIKYDLKTIETKAQQIEQFMFDKCNGVTNEYRTHFRTLPYNIKHNILLQQSLISNELSLMKLFEMDYKQLAPLDLVKQRSSDEIEMRKENLLPSTPENSYRFVKTIHDIEIRSTQNGKLNRELDDEMSTGPDASESVQTDLLDKVIKIDKAADNTGDSTESLDDTPIIPSSTLHTAPVSTSLQLNAIKSLELLTPHELQQIGEFPSIPSTESVVEKKHSRPLAKKAITDEISSSKTSPQSTRFSPKILLTKLSPLDLILNDPSSVYQHKPTIEQKTDSATTAAHPSTAEALSTPRSELLGEPTSSSHISPLQSSTHLNERHELEYELLPTSTSRIDLSTTKVHAHPIQSKQTIEDVEAVEPGAPLEEATTRVMTDESMHPTAIHITPHSEQSSQASKMSNNNSVEPVGSFGQTFPPLEKTTINETQQHIVQSSGDEIEHEHHPIDTTKPVQLNEILQISSDVPAEQQTQTSGANSMFQMPPMTTSSTETNIVSTYDWRGLLTHHKQVFQVETYLLGTCGPQTLTDNQLHFPSSISISGRTKVSEGYAFIENVHFHQRRSMALFAFHTRQMESFLQILRHFEEIERIPFIDFRDTLGIQLYLFRTNIRTPVLDTVTLDKWFNGGWSNRVTSATNAAQTDIAAILIGNEKKS